MDDDPVKTVVYKNQQAAKQLCKRLHRSSSLVLVSITRSSDRRPVVSKFQIFLASVSAAICSLCLAFTANAAQLISNGGFESGDFTGWTTASSVGSGGGWFVATGPLTPLNGFP